jgi:hypothetical protein
MQALGRAQPLFKGDFGMKERSGIEATSSDSFGMCGRCYNDNLELFPANCAEKPEAMAGQPLGMYHCPDCGAMVMAGIPHPTMCARCIARQCPGFDVTNKTKESDDAEKD